MKKSCLLRITLFAVALLIACATAALAENATPATGQLQLVLDMFRYDQYLPALDLLEASEDTHRDDFNYWLYRGLGYQRSAQTRKALAAYEKAAKLNTAAGNLQNRIKALQIEIEQKNFRDSSLDTPAQKAAWLFAEAEKLQNRKKEEQAFRYYLQAVDYDPALIKNDNGFISRGNTWYQLKLNDKIAHASLFLGIFKYLQNETTAAAADLQKFMQSSPRPPALERMATIYLKRLEENSGQKTVAKPELVSNPNNDAAASTPSAVLTDPLIVEVVSEAGKAGKTDKPARMSREEMQQLAEIEGNISENRPTEEGKDFVVRFATAMADKMIDQLAETEDIPARCRLIWELGETRLQNSEIMKALAGELAHEDPRVLRTACEAIAKIGMPTAIKAVTPLLAILETDDKAIQFNVIELLGKLKAMPEKVIPALARTYSREDDIYLKRNIFFWVNKFGKPGVEVLYRVLDNTARVDRKPVAELISRITGEKIQELLDR